MPVLPDLLGNPFPSQLDQTQIIQQVFDDNRDALRVVIDKANPIFSVNANVQVDTVNADISVDIQAAAGDNIAIASQDGNNHLIVNPDGSINVNTSGTVDTPITNIYNEVINVSSETLTTIISKTMISSGKLPCIMVSGSNIGTYTVELNSVVISKARTYFGGDLNYFFDFKSGITLFSGDVVRVRVIHNRPFLGDFNAMIETMG
jgi:hypothetical protein